MLFPVIVKKLKTMEVSILIIRQERPEDYDTVYHVVKEAFENAEYTDGNEQNLETVFTDGERSSRMWI